METKRLILFVVFSFALLLLWDSWQQKQIQTELAITNSDLSENQANIFDSLGGLGRVSPRDPSAHFRPNQLAISRIVEIHPNPERAARRTSTTPLPCLATR